MKLARLIAVLFLTPALGGCGFHLVGNRALPDRLAKVHIDVVSPYTVSEPTVETELRSLLRSRGSEVFERQSPDATLVQLRDLRASQSVLTVGPDGKALEYELTLRVNFSAKTGDNLWMSPSMIEVRRDYSFNAQEVLPKEQEAARLREYLEVQMAELILLRLDAEARRAVEPAASPDAQPESAPEHSDIQNEDQVEEPAASG